MITTSATDRRVVLALLLIVPLVVARPFSQVGAEVDGGRAYRAYFTADYVWRRAVVAELSKGDFLPQNPFFRAETPSSDPLHYYWLPHLPNAIAYRALDTPQHLDSLLLGSTVVVDAAFMLAIYGLTRLLLTRAAAAGLGTMSAVLFTSAEGIAAVWRIWQRHEPWSALRSINIDAVSRWYMNGMPIDSVYRILWYQPHHAMAYLMGFIAMAVVARRKRQVDPAAFFTAGVLLGVTLLFSSFTALMFVVAIAVHEGIVTTIHNRWGSALAHALASALPLLFCAAVMASLHYVDDAAAGLAVFDFGLNPVASSNVLSTTLVSAGPILLLSTVGVVFAREFSLADTGIWLSLIASSIVMYFFVDVIDHEHVYVGWRVGHVVFMALAPFAGLAWARILDTQGIRRQLSLAAALAVLASSLPTFAIDLYNTQDIGNRGQGPSFRWTLVLQADEWEGLMWLRAHTRPDAIAQVDPYSRGNNTWAYLPAFAERRMATGLPISMVPLKKYVDRSTEMIGIFNATDMVNAYEQAARMGIDFVVVGEPERLEHPGINARYASVPHLFQPVFDNPAMTIYAVRRPGQRLPLL